MTPRERIEAEAVKAANAEYPLDGDDVERHWDERARGLAASAALDGLLAALPEVPDLLVLRLARENSLHAGTVLLICAEYRRLILEHFAPARGERGGE